jgi:hypothetical protein
VCFPFTEIVPYFTPERLRERAHPSQGKSIYPNCGEITKIEENCTAKADKVLGRNLSLFLFAFCAFAVALPFYVLAFHKLSG